MKKIKRAITKRIPIVVLAIAMIVTGAMPAASAVYAVASNITGSGITAPADMAMGRAFTPAGTIQSAVKLSEVTVGVIKSGTDEYLTGYDFSASPNALTYNLSGAAKSMDFTKLPEGTYRYLVIASDSNGTTKTLIDKTFKVTANNASLLTAPKTMKLAGATTPSINMTEGSSFTAKGTITSTYKLTGVKVGVWNRTTTSWESICTVTKYPNATSFNINSVDSQLQFNKLKPGVYRYCVWGRDEKGQNGYLKIDDFYVNAKPAELFTISGSNYPTALKTGEAYAVQGKVTSQNNIVSITVGIMSDTPRKWISGHVVNTKPNTKSFDIATARSGLKFETLPAGTYVYRVDVADAKGNVKVLVNKKFTVSKPAPQTSLFTTSGCNYPTTLKAGDTYAVQGKVTSQNNIVSITVGIMSDVPRKWISGHVVNTKPNTKSFDIATARNGLKFETLPAGTYVYRVDVADAKGNCQVLINKKFTVSKPAASSSALFSLSGSNYPSAIKAGDSYSVKGKVTSQNNIVSITVGIMSDTPRKWISGHTVNTKPNTKSFDISTVRSGLKFETLPPGTYVYRIDVADDKGNCKVLLNKKFTVGKLTISGAKWITEMIQGSYYTVRGTVQSTYKMVYVRVGIVNKSNGDWVASRGTVPNATTYDINKLDKGISFDKLPVGNYQWRVYVKDERGTSKYVLQRDFKVTTEAAYKETLTKAGFPASYTSYLTKLHKSHPDWVFKVQKTGLDWNTVIGKEYDGNGKYGAGYSVNWVPRNWGNTWKKNPSDIREDSWTPASKKAIAYYMDPRNFLNEANIYQFMDHRFYAETGSKDYIKKLTSRNSCFLNTTSYINAIYNAGVAANVNPCIITSMLITEQGWRGGSDLISGKNKSFPGYYNFFNVQAYDGYLNGTFVNRVYRGLWYAKGSGVGATSYGRPWNSPAKAITGGAKFYAAGYLNNNQYTYYTKKFNVMNGLSNVATHQYSTAVTGASTEGNLVKYCYADNDQMLTFCIPVYNNMGSSASPRP